jgi:hypothetical protein
LTVAAGKALQVVDDALPAQEMLAQATAAAAFLKALSHEGG